MRLSRYKAPAVRKPLKRNSKIKNVNRRRKAKTFARAFGSKKRVEWVKSLPCAACGVLGRSQNAHLLGNGGASRREDFNTIGPLCGPDFKGYMGCHTMYDEHWSAFCQRFPDFWPEDIAVRIEVAWQRHINRSEE